MKENLHLNSEVESHLVAKGSDLFALVSYYGKFKAAETNKTVWQKYKCNEGIWKMRFVNESV